MLRQRGMQRHRHCAVAVPTGRQQHSGAWLRGRLCAFQRMLARRVSDMAREISFLLCSKWLPNSLVGEMGMCKPAARATLVRGLLCGFSLDVIQTRGLMARSWACVVWVEYVEVVDMQTQVGSGFTGAVVGWRYSGCLSCVFRRPNRLPPLLSIAPRSVG